MSPLGKGGGASGKTGGMQTPPSSQTQSTNPYAQPYAMPQPYSFGGGMGYGQPYYPQPYYGGGMGGYGYSPQMYYGGWNPNPMFGGLGAFLQNANYGYMNAQPQVQQATQQGAGVGGGGFGMSGNLNSGGLAGLVQNAISQNIPTGGMPQFVPPPSPPAQPTRTPLGGFLYRASQQINQP